MKRLSTFASPLLLACLLGMAPRIQAQITVTDSLSTADIAQLLEGMNITISNVTVNCAPQALGHFIGSSELAMTQGLVLTSGAADLLAGGAGDFATGISDTPGDADLTFASGYDTHDACVLEFDCVPYGDTLLFNFSFGSEEYPEYVGSAFNDIFAIYLSGSDILFPENVAQLPDGTPVAINNVNAGLNTDYFHDNEYPPGQYVAYDGFTENLTAFAVVHPGDTYHFKVAIADAGDMILDSGVFLEAFSFRSVAVATGVDEQGLHSMGVRLLGGLVEVSLPQGQVGSQLNVYDALGRNVKQVRAHGQRFIFSAEDLPTGAYTVVMQDGSGLAPARFVKD